MRKAIVLLILLSGLAAYAESSNTASLINITVDPATSAVTILRGAGIPLPGDRNTPASADSDGNPVYWRQVRVVTDPRGGRHVFYRQYLLSGAMENELYGAEVGLHYAPSGSLRLILGHQFENVVLANRPRFGKAEAVVRALHRAAARPDFRPESIAAAQSHLPWREEHTVLKVVPSNAGFRYVWFTFVQDEHGVDYAVMLDAESEEIVGMGRVARDSNCSPTTPLTSVSAIGFPVRPDRVAAGVRRTLKANVTADRPAPFTHEGYYGNASGVDITVFQETEDSAFACSSERQYTVFPLMSESGTVAYREGPVWRGDAAGDALYHTKETMAAFATLGRDGWNGNGGDAKVVIQSTFLGSNDQAFFRLSGEGNSKVPPGAFLGIAPAEHYYNMASSLDLVAHEWGHGVIYTSADFNCTDPGEFGCQLHEGFADVIAIIVEKMRQPSGFGVEQSSDWTLHEDAGTGGYQRGAEDDGSYPGHRWYGLAGYSERFDQLIHRQDPGGGMHARGNMLSMALRLAVEGGRNPICSRYPAFQGCGTSVTGISFAKARTIFFDTLQFYLTSSSQWEDIPIAAKAAAFDIYNRCELLPSLNAGAEQQAILGAFNAIGYAGGGVHLCP